MDKSAIDLLHLCRRMNFEWQYIDTKMTTEKLVAIEKNCPYPSLAELTMPTTATNNFLRNLTCTKYFLELSFGLTAPERHRRSEITTSKSLFVKNEKFDQLSFKKKQSIYWMIRLRYGCGIVPIALLKMIPDLKKRGYKSWVLPTGESIPLSDIWLGDLFFIPRQHPIVYGKMKMGETVLNSSGEPIAGFSYTGPEGPMVQHSVILMKTNSSLYVVDPTSLQFGMEGPNGGLVKHATWDTYAEEFPGTIISALLENDEDAKRRLEEKWVIGNTGFNHCKRLIKAVMKDLDHTACSNCGNVERISQGVQLLMCGECKSIKYCDKLCQKSDWKNHKASCSA